MSDRRPSGTLEADVLHILWSRGTAATPAEVNEELSTKVAYNTVMTVLTRLWQKGLVERHQQGRAFAYRPMLTEAEHAAQRMRDELSRAGDREAVLSQFVGELTGPDADALRRVLNDLDHDV